MLRERARAGELSEAEHRVLEQAAIWRETQDLADEVRLLRARLETHAVTAATVRLAARLGHAPAGEALIAVGRDAPAPDQDLAPLLRSVVGSGPRIALAAARFAYAALEPPAYLAEAAEELFLVLDAWNACPCADHQALVDELARDCHSVYGEEEGVARDANPYAPLRAALLAAGPPGTSVTLRLRWYSVYLPRLQLALLALQRAVKGPEVPAPIRDEVVPWLLGYGDPVDARAEL